MNLRCSFCQTPFTIGRIEKLDALQHMDANNLSHYDAHCPRCRRSTPVLRQKLEMTFPNWREALKELETELQTHPQPEAPLPKPEPESATEIRHEHRARAGKSVKQEKVTAIAGPAEKKAKTPKEKPAARPKATTTKTATEKASSPKAKTPAKKTK